MRGQAGFFDVDDRLKRLSDLGDQLEAFEAAVDFEMFRPELNAALAYSDGTQGGRPPFDPVMMFKVLVIQATNNLSDERAEFLINDRLSFMRFLGFGLADRVPDARTIWLFREKLTKAGAIEPLFERFDAALRKPATSPWAGQIVDASLIAAPNQRNTKDEKKAIKDGRIPDDWKDKPAKLRQKDRDARWTVKYTKAKPREDGSTPAVDLAIPVVRLSEPRLDRSRLRPHPQLERDGRRRLRGRAAREGLLDKTNTASEVWADTAYRSKANEEFLARNGFVSRIPSQEAAGAADARAMRRANAHKSKVRSRVEHVFADAEGPDGPLHPHHRHREREDENRHGQPRLQREEARLPRPSRRRLKRRRPRCRHAAAPNESPRPQRQRHSGAITRHSPSRRQIAS